MNWQFRNVKAGLSAVGWRLLPGGMAAVGVVVLLKLGAWRSLEYGAYDALFHLRGRLPVDQRVVVIGIDDASLKELGRYPLPRHYYAQLITLLEQAEASVVVVDIVLSEATPDDQRLAETIAAQGRVVLARGWSSTGQPLLPTPRLQQGAIDIGHILNTPDSDGVTRQIAPQIETVPALGIAAIQAYGLVQEPVDMPDLRQVHPLWVNWLGPVGHIPEYSLVAVLRGEIPPQSFKDKIVVFGVTAAGLDSLPTPYNRTPPASSVYLHATVINNGLQQNFLHVLPSNWLVLMLLLGGPSLSAVLMYRNLRQQITIWLCVCVGWSSVTVLLFASGWWLPVASPMVLWGLTTVVTELSERLRINGRLKREIKHIWQTYCQDLLVWASVPAVGATQHHEALHGLNRLLLTEEAQPVVQLAQLADQFGRSQSAHAAIARSLSMGLLAADWDGLVWFCNPVAAEWLHIRMGDQLQPHLVPEWLSQTEWYRDLDHLHSGQRISRELQRGDRWFEITLEPLYYPPTPAGVATAAQSPTGLLLLLENITPRKQAEAEIRRALEQEKELYELKSRFVTTASHDFRTPLTIILGSAELLENYGHRWTDAKKHEHLHQIQNAVKNMTDLLNDVLLLSTAEAGKLRFTPQPLDLKKFCLDLVQHIKPVSQGRHPINIILEGLPLEVWMDEKLLRHIFMNLLSNAIKYSPQGSTIDFIVNCKDGLGTFQVCDQGIGIPSENLQHLFEPFYRADNTGNIAGTGLGLAIAREAIVLHGGQITVASELNAGTQITVVLPLGQEATPIRLETPSP